MADVPASLKKRIGPFLQRAKTCDAKYPVVAYFCRMHALSEGYGAMNEPGFSDDSVKPFILNLMGALEEAKKGLDVSEENGFEQCSGLAMMWFNKADNEDRAGAATMKTAQAFNVASHFVEVCKQFQSSYDDDLEKKRKYAKFKAVTIAKAIKSGVKPEAGPPGGDQDDEDGGALNGDASEAAGGDSADLRPTEYNSPSTDAPPSTAPEVNIEPTATSVRPPAPPPQVNVPSVAKGYSLTFDDVGVVEKAKKEASFAVAALSFNDVESAVKHLRNSLESLETIGKS